MDIQEMMIPDDNQTLKNTIRELEHRIEKIKHLKNNLEVFTIVFQKTPETLTKELQEKIEQFKETQEKGATDLKAFEESYKQYKLNIEEAQKNRQKADLDNPEDVYKSKIKKAGELLAPPQNAYNEAMLNYNTATEIAMHLIQILDANINKFEGALIGIKFEQERQAEAKPGTAPTDQFNHD